MATFVLAGCGLAETGGDPLDTPLPATTGTTTAGGATDAADGGVTGDADTDAGDAASATAQTDTADGDTSADTAGQCPDAVCDADESCESCPDDCGTCASPPTFVGDFEAGVLGDQATGPDGYSGGNAQGNDPAVYDAPTGENAGPAFTPSGTSAARFGTRADSVWFGISAMPIPGGSLAQGDEIWRQEKFWIPSSFDFSGGQPAVKWIDYAPNNGTARVYWNLNGSNWALISEAHPGSSYLTIPNPIARDQWVTVETWMKVTAGTDEPSMRLWVDGVFLGEKSTSTIGDPANLIDEIRVGDYWNNGAPVDQNFWVDDVVIYSSAAGDIPTQVDAGGRIYIGLR